MIKFEQSQALTSHFESLWSIVIRDPVLFDKNMAIVLFYCEPQMVFDICCGVCAVLKLSGLM